jgi:hypothetical protein
MGFIKMTCVALAAGATLLLHAPACDAAAVAVVRDTLPLVRPNAVVPAHKNDAPTLAELSALHAQFMQELQALNLTALAASPRDARATAAVRDIALHMPNHIRTTNGGAIKCWICEHVIEKFISFAVDHGCDAADAIAISLCEAAGLGPEDPLADACAAALCGACSWFVSDWVDKKIHDGKTLCDHIHWC